MYEAFYGFKEKPFSMLPDPGFLYLSKKHQAALTLLEYGLLNHVGFCVLSGEPGAGKTTILRAVLDRISDDVTVGLITNTHQSFGGLLDWVLAAFDLHRADMTHVEKHQALMEYLIEEYANNRSVLLIVDEAQNMNAESLEELRMLSNVNSEKDQLLQIVLAGQPALKDLLRKPELMQFAQRIAVDYHLDALSVEETCGYIQHRLVTAGAQKDVFTPAACERIHNYSGGSPRLINLLCETVLVYGFADQQEMIDVDLVDEMVQERMKDTVVPIVNRDIAYQDNSAAAKKLEETFPWIQPASEAVPAERVDDAIDEPVTPEKRVPEKQEAKAPLTGKNTAKPAVARQVKSAAGDKQRVPTVDNIISTPSQVTAGDHKKASASLADHPRITGNKVTAGRDVANREGRRQMLKYGVIALLLGAVLVALAIVFNIEYKKQLPVAAEDAVSQQELQAQEQAREQERVRLQREAEALKKERDAALLQLEEEKQAKQAAEEKARLAAKLAADEAEKERIAKQKAAREKKKAEQARREKERQKEQARLAREKEREAKYAAERERRKAARLEEEKRLKEAEEARRLEREWLETQRLSQTKKSHRQRKLA